MMLSYHAILVCSCPLLPNRISSRRGQLLTSFHNFFLVAKRGLPTYIQNIIMWYFTVQRRQFLWTSLTLLQTHWRCDFNVFHLQPSVFIVCEVTLSTLHIQVTYLIYCLNCHPMTHTAPLVQRSSNQSPAICCFHKCSYEMWT